MFRWSTMIVVHFAYFSFAQVVITEIMYNPNSAEPSSNVSQFVEIVNVTGVPVDLTNWEMGDSQDDEWNALPSVSIPPFGILVAFGSTTAEFTSAWGAAINGSAVLVSFADLSQTMFNLSNSPSATNETVAIRDAGDVIIDEVNFDDTSPWPSDSPDGPSIYLTIDGATAVANGVLLNDDGSNWARSAAGVDGAVGNVMTTIWNGADTGSPGNFHGDGGVSAFFLVNEVDAVTDNGDNAEFIEIHGPASSSMDGFVLVLYDGATDQSYDAIDLDGFSTNANGFFVICIDAANVENCDLDVAGSSAWLNDGVAAVAIYEDDATSFPNGTAVTDVNLIDAVVYDTDDADDSGLIDVLTPAQAQINENGLSMSLAHANARLPDGGMPQVTSSYVQQPPTPGLTNLTIAGIKINEYVANHAGMDMAEFVEILHEPNTDISNFWVLQIEGDSEDGPGVIHAAIQCGITNDDGLWFSGFSEDVFSNGSMTLLLVDTFTGALLDDLDTNDDGVLDTTPWIEIKDQLAVSDADIGDQVYSPILFLPGFDGDIFAPGGLSRIPNGQNTGMTSDWKRNSFSGVGIPGFTGTVGSSEAANTPNEANSTVPGISAVINEFVTSHGTIVDGVSEDHEYLEIFGLAEVDYAEFSLLQIDGDLGGNPGNIISTYTLGVTDIGGFWDTGFLDTVLSNSSVTFLLVKNFNGMVSDDLDSNDDGVFDATPWALIHDSVAVITDVGDLAYSSTALATNFDGVMSPPAGASRIPNGQDSNMVADWSRNDFDGEGLPGFPSGTLAAPEALNTPGNYNVTTAASGLNAIINEFNANHTGSDDHEYIEVYGLPDTSYTDLWVLVVEGDDTENPGLVDQYWQVGQTNSEGYWFSGFLNNQLENNTLTLMLVEGFSGPVGVDIDANDDGVVDVMPWTNLVDDVGVQDDGMMDFVYSASNMMQGFDGVGFTVGGASRIPNGVDTDMVADWLRNDFTGAGLEGFMGTLDPMEALNTPGIVNTDMLPPGTGAILSEFVIDHTGADTRQFIEVFGLAQVSYYTTWILVVDADLDGNPGNIDLIFPVDYMNSAGVWDTGYLNEMIPIGSQTLLLVEEFTGMVGDDLDTNDDGVLDLMPWDVVADSISLIDSDAGDFTYSPVVLTLGMRGPVGFLGGASRVPYGLDTDTASDWMENDFEGAGLDGFVGNLDSGEAFNSRGFVNRVGVDNGDYYATADASSTMNLRDSLHAIIRDHIYFPYTSDFTDTWDVLEMADEDPNNSGNILSIYKNATYPKQGGGNAFYNREHSWPKSFGFPDDELNAYPYTDMHHLRLADSVYNSTRNNISFGTCNAGCSELVTDVNNGVGGGSGMYPGNSNWHTGSGGNGIFEVWQDRRGDVARSLLYLDVRYEGGNHTITGAFEPDLILTDDIGLIQTTGINGLVGYMGRLAVLLMWHQQDPVNAQEELRNEILYLWQGNRNPFVDHPEWADCAFGDCSNVCLAINLPAWRVDPSQCQAGITTILDLVSIKNGTCTCP